MQQQQQRGPPPRFVNPQMMTGAPQGVSPMWQNTRTHAHLQAKKNDLAQFLAQNNLGGAGGGAGNALPAGGIVLPAPMPGAMLPPPPFQQQQQQQFAGRGGQHSRGRGGNNNNNGGRGGASSGPARPRREDDTRAPSQQLQPAANEEAPPPGVVDAAAVQEAAAAKGAARADEALIKQFLQRYDEQDEAEDVKLHGDKPVGLLNIPDCLKVIDENDVTFVVTDTGTGKSTMIPNALLDQGKRVVSSQPRRTATVNLALRVASLRGEKVGQSVGYWVRGDRAGTPDTCACMFMTSYTLLLYVISHPETFNFTHFIIDEFHERQADVEVTVALLRLAKQRGASFKIVLMSASVQIEEWMKYFEGLKVGEYSTCKPRYSIHEYYMEEVCRLVGAAYTPSPVTPTVHSLTLKNSLFLIERMLMFLAEHAAPQHSILVFLPGRTLVEQMSQWIKKNLKEQLDPIEWYRDVDLSYIQAALKRPATTRKKVYLATDIAEVSLTLPDVVFVIDSGTTKKPRIDPKNKNSIAFPPLELLWCSRSAIAQRRGRVGRVQQGFFFTCVPETHLPELQDMEPQIANSTINELALHVLEIAGNPFAVFNLCRMTPKGESVRLSMNFLLDGGCVMMTTHPKARLEAMETPEAALWREPIMLNELNRELQGTTFVTTVKGKVVQHLPLDIQSGSIVYHGLVFGLESIMILAAAICASGTPFYVFTEEGDRAAHKGALREKVSESMRAHARGLNSDIVCALSVAIEYKKMLAEGVSEEGQDAWCSSHDLSRIRLQNIIQLEEQIKEQLSAHIAFTDVSDVNVLQQQLDRHAPAISFLVAASHLERALFIKNDRRRAQAERQVGPSIFLGIDALCDMFVATACPWDINHIVIPLSIQVRYEKLLGAFAMQLTQKEFNLLLLMMVHDVVYEQKLVVAGPEGLEVPATLFGVQLHGNQLIMRCDPNTGATILQFREIVAARLSMLRVMMKERLTPNDAEDLQRAFRSLPDIATRLRGFDDYSKLTPSLLHALEFVVSGPARDKLVCEPFHDPTFAPKFHSMLLSSAPPTFAYEKLAVPAGAADPTAAAATATAEESTISTLERMQVVAGSK